ncbi:hypothetical protein GQ457_06G007540 [Hibiscus cannabinus]
MVIEDIWKKDNEINGNKVNRLDMDPQYRYPRGSTGTQGTDTLTLYRYPFWEYRYPLSRITELAGKTPTTAPNKVQRSPTARNTFGTIKQASKHQEKANASLYNIIMIKNWFPPKPRKGDESISELVEILSGEAKVVDVELG